MNLRDNYFVKLIKYIKNVYYRQANKSYYKHEVKSDIYHFTDYFTGFLLRIQRFNQLNNMIKNNEFNNVCPSKKGLPKIDVIRNLLKSINLNVLRQIIEKTIKKAVKNKVLDSGIISDVYCIKSISFVYGATTEKSYFVTGLTDQIIK